MQSQSHFDWPLPHIDALPALALGGGVGVAVWYSGLGRFIGLGLQRSPAKAQTSSLASSGETRSAAMLSKATPATVVFFVMALHAMAALRCMGDPEAAGPYLPSLTRLENGAQQKRKRRTLLELCVRAIYAWWMSQWPCIHDHDEGHNRLAMAPPWWRTQ
jgi:hypothetical protein